MEGSYRLAIFFFSSHKFPLFGRARVFGKTLPWWSGPASSHPWPPLRMVRMPFLDARSVRLPFMSIFWKMPLRTIAVPFKTSWMPCGPLKAGVVAGGRQPLPLKIVAGPPALWGFGPKPGFIFRARRVGRLGSRLQMRRKASGTDALMTAVADYMGSMPMSTRSHDGGPARRWCAVVEITKFPGQGGLTAISAVVFFVGRISGPHMITSRILAQERP